jgi:hypothetical protein
VEINDLGMGNAILQAAPWKQAFALCARCGWMGPLFLTEGNEATKGFSTSFSLFPAVQGFSFYSFSFVPLWRGQVVTPSHGGNDYATSRQKRKTYGRYLVRFFRKKVYFASFLGASLESSFATCTESIIYK